MFGSGNYGDHYDHLEMSNHEMQYLESSQAELAIIKPNGKIMGEPYGWVSPDFVAALIPVVATGDEAEMENVIQNIEHRDAESFGAENWGGDPKGKLALALQKARDKAKEPKKPLKIEKLGVETSGQYCEYCEEHHPDEVWDICNAHHYDKYAYAAESFATEGKFFVCDACEETLPLKLRNRSLKVAQEFGMGIGDICRPCVKRIKSYEEEVKKLNPPKTWADYYNAPTKGIDTFTQPFEESSLDSGGLKKVLVGLAIGGLAYLGYNKWK